MLNARSKAANVIGLPKKRNTEPKNRKVNHDNIAFQQHLDYCDVSDENRFDCTPGGMSQEECLAHGCCWREAVILMRTINIPYCFFPSNYYIYNIEGEIKKTDLGYEAELTIDQHKHSFWPNDIAILKIDLMEERDNCLHFKVYCLIEDFCIIRSTTVTIAIQPLY